MAEFNPLDYGTPVEASFDPNVYGTPVETPTEDQAGVSQPIQEEQPQHIDFQAMTKSILDQYNAGNYSPRQVEAFDELKKRGAFDTPMSVASLGADIPIGQEERAEREETLQTIKGIPEVAATVATSAVAEPISGVAGIVGSVLPGEKGKGSEFVKKTQDALTFGPKSESGKQALRKVGELAKNIPDVGKAVGDFAFDVTGSPGLAAFASATPSLIGELIGLKGLSSLRRGTKLIDSFGEPTKALVKVLEKEGLDFDLLSPQAKAVIPEEIDAGFIKRTSRKQIAEEALIEQIQAGAKDDALAKLRIEDGRVVSDSLAKKAVGQGFSEGFVQSIKSSSPKTKQNMLKMSNMMKRIKKNERLGLDMRPSDIIGDSVTDRVKFIKESAETARKDLNKIADTKLRGQKISGEGVLKTLNESLSDLDISISTGKNGVPAPEFKGSLISKDRSSQKVIRDLIDIMSEGPEPDALRFHKLKRQLDIMIDFNKKSAMGLSDAGKSVLKKVRYSLNDTLRKGNPDYARVNDIMSQSLNALNDLDKSLGTMDLFGEGSNKAIGQRMRALLSNQQGRIKMDNALNDIETVSKNLGGRFDDDIKDLVMFADGLESRFGTVAKTSFAGQVAQGASEAARHMKPSILKAAATVAGKGYEKVKGINDFTSFEALEKIIKR